MTVGVLRGFYEWLLGAGEAPPGRADLQLVSQIQATEIVQVHLCGFQQDIISLFSFVAS